MEVYKKLFMIVLLVTLSVSQMGCEEQRADQFGELAIFSNISGAKVYIGEDFVGVTPLIAREVADSHNVRVSCDGYLPWEQTILLPPGEQVIVEVSLAKPSGSLYITTLPTECTVLIEQNLYSSPLWLESMGTGTYNVIIDKSGYVPAKMPVTIAQGQETHLEVILEPEAADESSGNLRLETEELVKRILEPLRAKAARVAQASPTEVYLNQGYGQMKVGERYEIVGPGEPIYDPNTGDLIGHQEQHRGVIEISRVRQNMSIGTPRGLVSEPFQVGDLVYQLVDTKKIAVYRFTVPNQSHTLLSWTLQEAVLTALAAYPEIEVVERQQLDQVIDELKLSQTGLIDEDSIKEVGKILGVDAIIVGSITDLGSKLDLDMRLIETETGLLISSTIGSLVKDSTIASLLSTDIYTSDFDFEQSQMTIQTPKSRSRGAGRQIRVPQDYAAIRQAVDAAKAGDTIIVAPGTYYDYLDFRGKSITIRSVNPLAPDIVSSTILTGGPANPTIANFSKGENNDTILEGFTIKDSARQAVFISNRSSPTIRRNVFVNNKEGAITILGDSQPVVEGNHFKENSASQFYFLSAGAIYIRDSSPTIINNQFAGNKSARSGGAIYVEKKSAPKIAGNVFISNHGGGLGGGAIFVSKEALAVDMKGTPWPRYAVPPYTEPANEYMDNLPDDVCFE